MTRCVGVTMALAASTLIGTVSAGSYPQTTLSSKLNCPWYGHGGGFGFAGPILDDPTWSKILRLLMPDVHSDCTYKNFDPKDSIIHLENNPVATAYSYEYLRKRGCASSGFEWDMFIPPEATASDPQTDRILIAHGVGSKHLRKEASGVNTYYDVKNIPKTAFGGVVLKDWIALFTRAVLMARNPGSMSSYVSRDVPWSLFASTFAAGQPSSGQVPFTAVLDVKTGAASVSLIRAIIRDLNGKGVAVSGVGSFNRNQIMGVEQVSQSVGSFRGTALPVLFYHGLRQRSIALLFKLSSLPPQFLDDVDSGNVPRGIGVAFNAGFLIDYNSFATGTAKRKSYALDTASVTAISNARRSLGLQVGLYTQEYDLDRWALGIMRDAVKRYSSTFTLGFSWGGPIDKWYTDIEPSFTDATVGTDAQAFLSQRIARSDPQGGSSSAGPHDGPRPGGAILAAAVAAAAVAVLAAAAVIYRRARSQSITTTTDAASRSISAQNDRNVALLIEDGGNDINA